jgi:hypothetical protein
LTAPCDARPVYVEFPDFGFGPASVAVALINNIQDPYDWHVVSTGSAAAFAQAHLQGATHHRLDTFARASWEQFRGLAPSGALTVSVTNPDFAAWAAEEGYLVGIVDTLDWMWPSLPATVDQVSFHLAQAFFGHTATADRRRPPTEVVEPIVDLALWCTGGVERRPGTVVIGFGGMHLPLPFGDRLVADYTRWMLGAALPILVERPDISKVTIVGGRLDLPSLVPSPWSRHPAIEVYPPLPQPRYSELLRSATYQLLSPGLGSLYECAASGLTPLLQPGWNMSMLLQSYHVARTGYRHLCRWPWLEEAVADISDKPEDDGLTYLAERIWQTIREDLRRPESMLAGPILRYLESGQAADPLRLEVSGTLPTATERLSHYLQSASG